MKPRTIILAAALFVGVAGEAYAQQSAPSRVPVTIVLAEQPLPSGAPFIIQRRPDQTPQDVILLRADATADQLSDAVRSLLTIRHASGDVPAAQATMRMRPQDARTTRRAFPWVQRVLGDVQRAAYQDVSGVGRVRAVEIWLPRQNRRTARR
jgi:hypothetical protein